VNKKLLQSDDIRHDVSSSIIAFIKREEVGSHINHIRLYINKRESTLEICIKREVI
jgi:hypothetical protein